MSEVPPEVVDPGDGLICSECGGHEPLRWAEQRKAKLIARGLCFTCCYWHELIDRADDPDVVRTDRGWHYVIGEDKPHLARAAKGGAGRKWIVTFTDGREVRTDNLWVQGEIPARFRSRLPVNAVLQSDENRGSDA